MTRITSQLTAATPGARAASVHGRRAQLLSAALWLWGAGLFLALLVKLGSTAH